jgi:RNA polymerase sigma-70 factor (ECF subfamily)
MAEEVRQLVVRAQRGDSQAAAGLLQRYRGRVIRFCLTFAPIREPDAHDITQEVFIRALGGIHALREASSFEGWLLSIARRRCLTFLKKLKRRRMDMERLALEQQTLRRDAGEEERIKKMERAIVAEEIERLPESRMKQAGRLFYLEGQDTTKIAQRLDAPISTVTTWLSRFRGKIRRRLVLRILALRGHEAGEAS